MRAKRRGKLVYTERGNLNPVVPAAEPLLLDIHGAARALSSSVWAVRSLLWDGQIPFVKIGRKYLIDPADIRAFVAREKSGSVA
jgi:excisionase family DNA binding protein